MKKKIIGVLGGMGPESTANFYHELILQCQKQYGARYDEDYPEMFVYNLPIPDVVEGLKKQEKTLEILLKGAKKLQTIGVDFIVMPCCTAHYFYEEIKREISIPFLSITEETAKKVKNRGFSQVGLLATETTLKYKLYSRDFIRYGIDILVPGNMKVVTKIILNILVGKKLDQDREELQRMIEKMKKDGAQAIILGCTDLPILITQKDVDLEVIDTVEVLAESTIKFAATN